MTLPLILCLTSLLVTGFLYACLWVGARPDDTNPPFDSTQHSPRYPETKGFGVNHGEASK